MAMRALSRHSTVCFPRPCRRHHQRGAALIVAWLLLVAMTLTSFAVARAALLQQRMAAYAYDRELAFQSAEAALRVAEHRVATHASEAARDCLHDGKACLSNPFGDTALPVMLIHEVMAGDGHGQFGADTRASMQPQYVVDHMGEWTEPAVEGADVPAGATYYRVTARSGDPATVGERAVVVLQVVLRQRASAGAVVERVSWRELQSP